MRLPSGVPRLFRVVIATLLTGLFVTGFVLFVAARLDDGPGPDAVSEPPVPAEEVGCDFGPDGEACPDEGLVDAPTFEGALERYRQGIRATGDARFLLLTSADYEEVLSPVFGPAVLRRSDSPFEVPVWEASYGDLSREGTFSWEQQWELVGGSTMFEHVFVFGSDGDALTFLSNHAGFMDGLGVGPTRHGSTGDGSPSARPLLFRFVDADASDPALRCVNRALAATGPMVFSVTLLTGGDCTTPDPSIPAEVVSLVRTRAEQVLG
jgi:hypothetical protein